MRLNEQIVGLKEIRLISDDEGMVGVVPFEQAMRMARESELDLVEISPTAEPPVCRLMDFGKYKYQQQKKLNDQRKRSTANEMKQIRIKNYRIDPHDLEIKLRKTREFLEHGSRVLVTMMFKAREHDHADMGAKLLREQFFAPLEDIAKIDSQPRKDGRRMTMTIAPLPNLDKILARRVREAEKEAKKQAALAVLDAGETQESSSNPPDEPPAPEPHGDQTDASAAVSSTSQAESMSSCAEDNLPPTPEAPKDLEGAATDEPTTGPESGESAKQEDAQ